MESCNTERMKELTCDFYTNELGAMTKSKATTSTGGNQVALKADVGRDNPRSGLCFNCHKAGHRARNCPFKKHQTSKPKEWCSLHKTKTHSNEECRVQQKSAGIQDEGTADTTALVTTIASQATTSQPQTRSSTGAKLILMVDSGCTDHMLDLELFTQDIDNVLANYIMLKTPRSVPGIGHTTTHVTGQGTLPFYISDSTGTETLAKINVLLVPSLGRNLFSTASARERGADTIFTSTPHLRLGDKQFPIRTANSLYYLDVRLPASSTATPATTVLCPQDQLRSSVSVAPSPWSPQHSRHGHLGSHPWYRGELQGRQHLARL
ncbi:unnamed protein product [Discosporangium mesarthrocarpum]